MSTDQEESVTVDEPIGDVQAEVTDAGNTEDQSLNGADETGYGDYPPGTIVLAKMKSFPPWPGIVVPTELVPENILKGKPKHPSVATSTKKKSNEAEDHRLWCVRFLRDDNFMWATIKDIQLLTKESIEKFLNAKKKPKKTIKAAYEMALNPPDLEEFIIYGSDGKPITIDNEADDADFEDEYVENDGTNEDDDGSLEEDVLDEDDSNLDIEPRTTPKKRKTNTPGKKAPPKKSAKSTPASTPARGRKKKVAKVEVVEDPETSSDEDWDADHEPDEIPVAVNIPSSHEISDLLKKKVQQVKKIRLQLQSSFLEIKELDNIDLKSVNSSLDTLIKLNDIESSLIKTTGLYKVLFDILKRPDLDTKELKKFRKKLNDFVWDLYNLSIDVDQKWDFIEREETEQPHTEKEGTEQPEQLEQTVEQKEETVKEEESVKEEIKEEETIEEEATKASE